MCLYNRPSQVKQLLRKGAWQLMYKVYTVDLQGIRPKYNYVREYLDLTFNEVKSNSRARGVSMADGGAINRGIHVYRNEKSMIHGWWPDPRRKTVKFTGKEIDLYKDLPNNWKYKVNESHDISVRVWCHKDDLIGANHSQAVYKKVYIHEQDYAHLVRKYHNAGIEDAE